MIYFDNISPKYDRIRGGEFLSSLLKTVTLFYNGNNDYILDIGTGTGRFSKALAKKGYRIIGIDKNSQMLAHAISKGKNFTGNFKGVLGSAEQLPFPSASFNLAISTNAIHHFNLFQHIQEVLRILKPGGYYIIFSRFYKQNVRSIWGQNFPSFAEKETRLYNPEDFEQLENIFPELKLESIKELMFEIPFSANQLINEAQLKKYSTFAFYTEEEFQQALEEFQSNIVKQNCKVQKVEIGRVVFRKRLEN